MTVVAAQFAVVAVQRELRISRVIEARVVPSNRAVAVLALLATFTVVGVVFRMAAVTCCGSVLERLVLVAGKALRFKVEPDQ